MQLSQKQLEELDKVGQDSLAIMRLMQRRTKPGRITETITGPTVTTHFFNPGEDVKVADVISESKDIARELCVESVRIYTRDKRKELLIEVPRLHPEIVPLQDLLDSPAFTTSTAQLPVSLGKDALDDPVIVDLASMPHLLIGGTTGAGKSTLLDALILSLLHTYTETDLQLYIIDPKAIDFAPFYKVIPHLGAPIVTGRILDDGTIEGAVEEASTVLDALVYEMLKRKEILHASGLNTIEAYRDAGHEMPYILLAVDELADLLLSGEKACKSCQTSLQRLAQMGRAFGIHLILCTQRPCAKSVPSQIKANMPARIALFLRTAIDSRVILDEAGAESLLRNGDMLLLQNTLTRIQAPYISKANLKSYLTAQYGTKAKVFDKPESQQTIQQDNILPPPDPDQPSSRAKSYCYVASNTGMPGVYKIGSSNDLKERMSKLSRMSTSPGKFVLEAYIKVPEAQKVEKTLHHAFDYWRITSNREYFEMPLDAIEAALAKFGTVKTGK